MEAEELSRQRIDYEELPDGSVKAILTVTLPGGRVERFSAQLHPNELSEVSGIGMLFDPAHEVGNIFGDIVKGIGKVAKGAVHVVKEVVGSKVMQVAAKGLAVIAPALGPLAPAALATSATLGIAGKLAKAGIASKHGAKSVAKVITDGAIKDAAKLTKTASGAAALLKQANKKRTALEKIAAKNKSKSKPAAKSKPIVKPASGKPSNVIAAARAGRVRSNKGGKVSSAELLRASQSGRVFWVH